MDKFSLYDLLGLVLPGILFLVLTNQLFLAFDIPLPYHISLPGNFDSLSVFLCFALISGACIYVLNFWLVDNLKVYTRWLGIYKSVALLYLELPKTLHKIMNPTFNKKAGESIFYSQKSFSKLDENKTITEKQELFFDKMYYDLEYFDKIDSAKTFQSFYFFFRQLVSVFLILIMLTLILYVLSAIAKCSLFQNCLFTSITLIALSLLFIVCLVLARWYRKRMVLKMYWAYYTLLTNK